MKNARAKTWLPISDAALERVQGVDGSVQMDEIVLVMADGVKIEFAACLVCEREAKRSTKNIPKIAIWERPAWVRDQNKKLARYFATPVDRIVLTPKQLSKQQRRLTLARKKVADAAARRAALDRLDRELAVMEMKERAASSQRQVSRPEKLSLSKVGKQAPHGARQLRALGFK